MKQYVVGITLIALSFWGCDRRATQPARGIYVNHAPIITQLTANTPAVDPNVGVTILCQATDSDADVIGFSETYSSPGITFSNPSVNDSLTQAIASWSGSSQPGLHDLIIAVSDNDLMDLDTVQVLIYLSAPTLSVRVLSNTQTQLSWNDTTSLADSMRIERKTEVTEYVQVGVADASLGYYVDSDLTPLTKYYYRLAAWNQFSYSNYSDVVAAYTAVMPDSGLFAWYPLNGDAADSSNFGHNGSLLGAEPIQDRFGNAGQALNFNGQGARVELPPQVVQLPSFTLVAWINWSDNITGNQPILHAWNGQGGYLTLTPKAPPHFKFTICDGPVTEALQALPPLTLSEWTLVAVRINNGQGTLYRNAIPVYVGAMNISPEQAAGTGLWLGGNPNSGIYFMGSMDDVRIYNRALEDNEIELLYHEGGWQI
jgi:hypothetical protein